MSLDITNSLFHIAGFLLIPMKSISYLHTNLILFTSLDLKAIINPGVSVGLPLEATPPHIPGREIKRT